METKSLVLGLSLAGFLGISQGAFALEVNEKLSLEANLTWVHQWLEKKKGDFKDKDRGSAVLDGRLSFKPTEVDEFSLRASFAKENGLKKVNPFVLSPNADDLRDDLHNINGRSRDHLQELWYARTFSLPGNFTLKGTLGIIDATAFIDENRFANDELTQFMNEALVNNPTANLVSYDYGVALELGKGPFSFKVLGMQSKTEFESEDLELKRRFHRKNYNYYASQVGYRWEPPLGEGNLRVYGFTTNKKFPSFDEEPKKKALKGWGVSFDQDLIKEHLGVFARVGFQSDKVLVDYKSMYSLGLSSKICIPRFRELTLGAGYAYLKAPSKHEELKNTRLLEAYVAIPLYKVEKKFSSILTLDWQYMKDKLKENEEEGIPSERRGHIWGIRLNLAF